MKHFTLFLSAACLFVFALQLIFPEVTGELALTHEFFHKPWQLFTNIFAHASFPHLFFNLFALLLFGSMLESLEGSRRFAYLFLSSLLLTDIASLMFYPATVGMSGIIYAILGALAVLRPSMLVLVFGMPLPLILAIIFWALVDLVGVFYPSGVANASHLAGLITGVLFGIAWKMEEKRKEITPL